MSRRRRRARVFSVIIAALAALVGARARAAESLDLAFSATCTDLDRVQVRKIANIELRVRLAGQNSTPLPSVTIDCTDVSAIVHAATSGGPPRERVVPFSGTATVARSRLLALAITEFVLTPDLAPEPPLLPEPVPAAPIAPPTVQVAAVAPGPAARAPLALMALGYARIWSAGWASAGAGLAYSGWFARYGLVEGRRPLRPRGRPCRRRDRRREQHQPGRIGAPGPAARGMASRSGWRGARGSHPSFRTAR